MKSVLIIGGGFSGCATAHMLSMQGGWDITLVEANPFLGAGNRTRWYGGHPYTFGPRHFLTPFEHVYEFINKYVPMRSCADHEFLTYVEKDSSFYHYPIHRDDLDDMPETEQIYSEVSEVNMAALSMIGQGEMAGLDTRDVFSMNIATQARNFEEFWIKSIGETLYRKFIDGYSKKMWMVDDNKEIDDFSWSPKGVTIKEGDKSCWNTAISAYPIAINGYDDYFRLATENVRVLLNTRIEHCDIPNKEVVINGEKKRYDIIVNSISPDDLFDNCHGRLEYVGRKTHMIVLPIEFALPEHVYFCYYANNEAFTRLTEYKKFTLHKSPTTLVSIEIPTKENRIYPMPIESEKAKAQKYFDEMPDGVFSIGRAGKYLYNVDIDETILHAMEVRDALAS